MIFKKVFFLFLLLIFAVEGYCHDSEELYREYGSAVSDLSMDNAGVTSIPVRQQRQRIRVGRFIKPMGVATFSLVFLSVFTGLFRRKLGRYAFKWHKILGVVALVSAVIHGSLVMIIS